MITLDGTSDAITDHLESRAGLCSKAANPTRSSWSRSSRTAPRYLRFGDDINGRNPGSRNAFSRASYRIGNGTAGNVGAESLSSLRRRRRAHSSVHAIRSPATGGIDPETNDQIRRRAPQAFLTQERAVTMADYAAMTELNPQVDRAVGVAPLDRELVHGLRRGRTRTAAEI